MTKTERLRQLLREGTVVAPSTYDGIVARIIQEAGFPAVYISGSGLSVSRGKPDIGWLSLAEVAAAVRDIVDCVDVPVVADADTGYGGVLNVRRTVQEFERAGAAGLHMEDQVTPKRCAYFKGVQLIGQAEMVGKVRSAVEARQDPNFLIIARTDALQVNGLEDAIARGRAYLAAGADALFVNALPNREVMKTVREAFPSDLLVFNMNQTNARACGTYAEAGELGYRLVIVPGIARVAVLRAVRELMAELRRTETFIGFGDRMETFAEFNRFMGIERFQELEQRYLPEESRT